MPIVINTAARSGKRSAKVLRGYEEKCIYALVAGGDGTVHRFINQEDCDQPLALIPLGTANDLARAIGIPRHPRGALKWLKCAVPGTIDLIKVNGVRVATSAGMGMPYRILLRAETWKRNPLLKRLQRWVYVASMIYQLVGSRLPRYRFKVSCEHGVEEFSGHSLFIMNHGTVASCLRLSPHARIDDGHFDLVIFPSQSRWKTLAAVLTRKGLLHRKCQHAQITVDPPIPFFADGEPYQETSAFEISILPSALTVMKHRDKTA